MLAHDTPSHLLHDQLLEHIIAHANRDGGVLGVNEAVKNGILIVGRTILQKPIQIISVSDLDDDVTYSEVVAFDTEFCFFCLFIGTLPLYPLHFFLYNTILLIRARYLR